MKITAFAVLFLSLLPSAFAQDSGDRLQSFLEKYLAVPAGEMKPAGKSWFRTTLENGLFSTQKRKGKEKFRTRLGFELKTARADFFGLQLNSEYVIRFHSAKAPWIIFHPGFMGVIQSGLVGQLMESALRDFPEYNLVVIEGLSNREFARRNSFYSLGGLHEPFIIRDIVDSIEKERNAKMEEIILFGGSSSSFSILATPKLLNRRGSQAVVKGSFLTAGYDTLSTVYQWLKGEGDPDSTRISLALTRLGVRSAFKNYPREDGLEVHQLLERTLRLHRSRLLEAWKVFRPTEPVPNWWNYEQYLDSLSLSQWTRAVESPFFWLQSDNDPMPSAGQFARFLRAAGSSRLISGDLVRGGAHSAFDTAYGQAWLSVRKKLFVTEMLSQ